MICPKCESESPAGSVFCNTCGERIVLSQSDTPFGAMSLEDETIYEDELLGHKRVFTKEGLMARLVPYSLFVGSMGVVFLVYGLVNSLIGAIVIGLMLLGFLGFVMLNWAVVIWYYRKTGKPVDWGGGTQQLPKSRDVMAIEDDVERGFSPPGDAVGPSGKDDKLRRV